MYILAFRCRPHRGPAVEQRGPFNVYENDIRNHLVSPTNVIRERAAEPQQESRTATMFPTAVNRLKDVPIIRQKKNAHST
jgi:hypothetical protein